MSLLARLREAGREIKRSTYFSRSINATNTYIVLSTSIRESLFLYCVLFRISFFMILTNYKEQMLQMLLRSFYVTEYINIRFYDIYLKK